MGKPFGIVSASISLVLLIINGTVKIVLKTMGRKKVNIENLFSWLGGIESTEKIIFKGLI